MSKHAKESRMGNGFLGVSCALVVALFLPAALAQAQKAGDAKGAKPPAAAPAPSPDLTGVWTQYPRIGSRSAGEGGFVFSMEEPPMTPWAAAIFKSVKAPHTGSYTGES